MRFKILLIFKLQELLGCSKALAAVRAHVVPFSGCTWVVQSIKKGSVSRSWCQTAD